MNRFLDILKFFPYVLAAVTAVETTAAGMSGTAKKQIVLGSILEAAKIGEQVPVPLVATISTLIDTTVNALNASGVFNHGKAPVAPATT